jgi:hypothetical protein
MSSYLSVADVVLSSRIISRASEAGDWFLDASHRAVQVNFLPISEQLPFPGVKPPNASGAPPLSCLSKLPSLRADLLLVLGIY